MCMDLENITSEALAYKARHLIILLNQFPFYGLAHEESPEKLFKQLEEIKDELFARTIRIDPSTLEITKLV